MPSLSPEFRILTPSSSLPLDLPSFKTTHIISPYIQNFYTSALNEVQTLLLDDIG